MNKNLQILLIDPCYSGKGISNNIIPLSVGYIGSYLKKNLSNCNIKILKLSDDIIKYIENNSIDVLGVSNYLWNTNLSVCIAKFFKKKNPNSLIVFGGPEISKSPIDLNNFYKKYSDVDLFVEREGELAFFQIVKKFKELNLKKEEIRNYIKDFGNTFYINEYLKFVSGPDVDRVRHLDDIESPYVNRLFDEFLSAGTFQPLIQTNRGCPYKCTFCHEGMEYYNKIHFKTLDYTIKELDYIAERVNPPVGLHIADSNWGMYKQDIEISKHIKKLKDKYKWPMYIHCSTGKSQMPRIIETARILDGALRITNAVQSLNNDVLDTIKRTNLHNLEDYIKSMDTISEPDIILPLPNETKASFVLGLNKILDTKAPIRFTVHPTLLLNNTEMLKDYKQGKYNLIKKYRQNQNLLGYVDNKLSIETECNIFETETMPKDDVFYCRKYVVLMDALLREEPIYEVFYFLDSLNIKRSKLTMSLIDNLEIASPKINQLFENYISALVEENFDTEEEVFLHVENNKQLYLNGKKGGDLLRYSQALWIETFKEMIDWIFLNLSKFKECNQDELYNLKNFILHSYFDRWNNSDKEKKVTFDYNIIDWLKSDKTKKMTEFKEKIELRFLPTNYSNISSIKIWNSFGFNLDESQKFEYSALKRLYLSRLKRSIKLMNDEEPDLKLSQMARFSKEVLIEKYSY